MLRRIWAVYSVEVFKALRQKQTYIGPALIVLVVLLTPLLSPGTQDGLNTYGFVGQATAVALDILGFFLLLAFAAGLIAPDLGNGGIRMVLTRPIRRSEYVLGKLLLGMTYAFSLVLLAALSSWGVALALGELNGVTYGGELVYSAEEMMQAYLLGALLLLAPFSAATAFGLMVSACTRNATGAVMTAVGLWLVLDLAKHPLKITPYVFTTYLGEPWGAFRYCCEGLAFSWFPMVWYCLASSLAVFVLATAIAIAAIGRRNLGA